VKAVILAGGRGTRGKPYTEYFPKAMTPINDKPLIDYIVKYLNSFDFIKEIIIISDYTGLGGQIKNYYSNPKNGKKIIYYLKNLLKGFIVGCSMKCGLGQVHLEKQIKILG